MQVAQSKVCATFDYFIISDSCVNSGQGRSELPIPIFEIDGAGMGRDNNRHTTTNCYTGQYKIYECLSRVIGKDISVPFSGG